MKLTTVGSGVVAVAMALSYGTFVESISTLFSFDFDVLALIGVKMSVSFVSIGLNV